MRLHRTRRIALAIVLAACSSEPLPPLTPTPVATQSATQAAAPSATPAVTPSATPAVTQSAAAASGPASPSALSGPLAEVAARAGHTATTLPDGRVLVTGGCVIDGCGTATTGTFLVSPGSAAPVAGPDMAMPRDTHSATLTPAGVVIVGGFGGEGEPVTDSVEVFHPDSDTFAALAPLAVAVGGQAAAALGDGRVLVAGGWVRSHTYTATAEVVDPGAGTVTAAPDLPWSADALEGVALADGRVLITGGQIEPSVGTDAAAIFDGSTHSWQMVGPMTSPRFKHTSVLLPDGRVLVIGGTTDDRRLLATTELFDPATRAFSPGPDLLEPRYKMSGGAAVLADGRVLVGGGGRNIELIDVAAGSSAVVESLSSRGSFTTVTALGDASWLVLGGYDDRIALRRLFLVLDEKDLERA